MILASLSKILANLSKREKLILYLTLGLILLAFIYGLILEPLEKRWAKINKLILTREIKLKQNLRTISEKESISKEYQEYSRQVKAKGSDEKEIAALLQEVETIAAQTAVRLSNVKPGKIEDKKFYKLYILEVETEADIAPLTEFIYQLERSPQILSVRKLHLGTKSRRSSLLRGKLLITKVLVP